MKSPCEKQVQAYACPGTCERIVAAGTSRAKAPTCCAPTCRRRRPRSMVEVYAVDGGRSVVPGTEERTFHSASLSSKGAARQSPRDGSVSGASPWGHLKTSAAAPASLDSEASGGRRREHSAAYTHASPGTFIQTAQRRHRSAHDRRP